MPAAMAQEDLQKGAEPFGGKKTFTTIKENPITSVKNQYRSGTCWDYIQLYSAPSVIVSGEDGNYALEATLIAENGITYTVQGTELK
jgi:C1A family cysteine protease